jgi:hypothetical protein
MSPLPTLAQAKAIERQRELDAVPPPTDAPEGATAKPNGRASNGSGPNAPEEAITALVTEDSSALQFTALHAGQLLFDHDVGQWFAWSGTHWRRETTGLAFEWARQLARTLSESKKPGTRYALRKTSFAGGVERFARVDRAFAVTAEHWDRDPFLLGTRCRS